MDKLTKKQKGFVEDYVETGNGVQSALNNYDTNDYSTAGNIASENLNKPKIKDAILSIAEQIPNELLIEKHLELLTVPKIKSTMKKGDVVEVEESTDVQAIKAGLDMAYKLKGVYAPDKNINININQEQTPEQMAKGKLFDEWLKKQTL